MFARSIWKLSSAIGLVGGEGVHVRETECEQVPGIDSHECLLVESRVAVNDIPKHAGRCERQTHVR